jgi:hypothetical protein
VYLVQKRHELVKLRQVRLRFRYPLPLYQRFPGEGAQVVIRKIAGNGQDLAQSFFASP